jgi:predicted MFS family arabinose efflux permease
MSDSLDPVPSTASSESVILALVSAVQFVNILDFIMVMPMGPDFAAALDIPSSELGLIGGSYTAAAAFSGLVLSPLLDRVGRRRALCIAMAGLAISTALGGLAQGIGTLLLARVCAGFFGGPATSVAIAIVADAVPPERRGRAMGIVMGAFAAASVLGVPAGLELAALWGWRAPFIGVGLLGAAVTVLAATRLPAFREHLARTGPKVSTLDLLALPVVRWSFTATAVAMVGVFSLIPNLAAFVQFNRDFPREHLSALYFAGGIVAFFTTRIAGKLTDRLGSARVSTVGVALFVTVVVFGVVDPVLPVPAMFVGFMLGNSTRMVPMNALTSRVPSPEQRARFLSVQSAVQHLASAAGAVVSSRMLATLPSGSLQGIGRVGMLSAVLACLQPLLLFAVERRVRALEAARRQAAIHPAEAAALV